MDVLEVVPGRDIGKLHILKKSGNMNGEDIFLCRDERDRNIQFVESEIISQAGDAPKVIEEKVVEEPQVTKTQDKSPPSEESVLESLMSKPAEDLEGQEIVTILIGVYGDNPPDDLTVEELRHRLEAAGKPEEKTPKKEEKPKKGWFKSSKKTGGK